VLAKRKNHSAAIDGLRWPTEKFQRGNQQIAPAKRNFFAVRQSGYRAYQEKNCGAAIRVLRLPLQNFAQGLRVAPNGWCEA
jgi:hypothetical protein